MSSPKPNPDPVNAVFPDASTQLPASENATTPLALDVDAVTVALERFLTGRTEEFQGISLADKALREIVVARLTQAMSDDCPVADPDQQLDSPDYSALQQRARSVFVDHGYIEDVMQDLRTSDSSETRAKAAHILGLACSQRATTSLIAALFDDAPEVCRTAATALAQIGEPAVSVGPVSTLLNTNGATEQAIEIEAPLAELDQAAVFECTAAAAAGVVATDEELEAEVEPSSLSEEEQLSQEQETLRRQLETLEAQLRAAVVLRQEADKEVRMKSEQESRFRAETAIRRHEEEEARKRADEKAARRRYEDERRLATDQLARLHAEEEAHHRVQEEERLRLQLHSLKEAAVDVARRLDDEVSQRESLEKAEREEMQLQRRQAAELHRAEIERLRADEELLQRSAEDVSRKRAELEAARKQTEAELQQLLVVKARLETSQAFTKAEAERMREAEVRTRSDQELLVQRTEELRAVSEDIAARLAIVESAKEKAEEEDRQLLEIEARTQAAEEARRQLQAERMGLESEIRERTAKEQRLLEEIHAHAREQELQLEESVRRRNEEQTRRLTELENLRSRLEDESHKRLEDAESILSQIEALRRTEAAMLNQIDDVEATRHSLEEKLRRTTELVQRVEAEARMRAIEDERALAKLEEVRRNLAIEAQARAEHEDRIKKEIELLKTREVEQRNRVEQEIRRRAGAEMRLQDEKNRLKTEEAARIKAELAVELVSAQSESSRKESTEWDDDPVQNLRRLEPPATQRLTMAFRTEASRAAAQQHNELVDSRVSANLPDAIVAQLNSNDPQERATALAAVPSQNGDQAFALVVNHFDNPSPLVRNAAARALRELEPVRPVDSFTEAMEDASPERRRNIGNAIAGSGLAEEALNSLDGESREETYNSLCLLFVMAKAGEVQPLVEAIELHPDLEVRRAAIKLLNLSGRSELADAAAKRRLGHDPARTTL